MAGDDLGWRDAFSDSGGDTEEAEEDEEEVMEREAGWPRDGDRPRAQSARSGSMRDEAVAPTAMGTMAPITADVAVDASAYVGRIGPELRELRAAQGADAERYTTTHYDRLYGCDTPWNRDSRGGKTWCKDVHGPGCTTCTSCHFCRQKTTDVKTTCACGSWRRAPEGGRGRGSWCGWCLEMRIGENVDEAIADEEWRCPVCRDICNCSGANCLRAKRNLFPTQQLTHEALTYGWPSVAHYLITTAIVSGRDAPPMLNLPVAFQERRRRRQQGGNGGAGAAAHRGTISGLFGARSAKEAQAAALRAKVAERVRAAFGEFVDQGEDGEGGDDDGELSDEGDVDAVGARGGAARSSVARRGGERNARRRGARSGGSAAVNRDGFDSSDGSELNSSDSESDLEDDAAVENAPPQPTAASEEARALNGDRSVDVDIDIVDDAVVVVARQRAPPRVAHAHSYAIPGQPSTAASRRPATGETNGHRQPSGAPKQKRARTTYGGDGRPIEVWSDIDDGDIADVRVVRREGIQTSVERSVADIACEDDDVAASQMHAATSANGGGGIRGGGRQDSVLDDDAQPQRQRVVRHRRRRRRLPRPDDAQEFTVVNPDVVVDARNRAERASAQEDHEESRAAEGSGACAMILRDIRSAAAGVMGGVIADDVSYRDALVRSNASLAASMNETDSGIIVEEGELRAFCALVVRIVRERSNSAKTTPSAESLVSDARETLADAERFRAHDSASRAIILRALLRCTDHAMFYAIHASDAMTQLLTLMAELGQEYCLIRDNMRSGADVDEAPPPLPEHIQARVAELNADPSGDDALSADDRVAMLLLERLEASHVLLYATMAALRRSARGPPVAGREALFCPTLAAFLSPAFPFKIKLRKQALRLVATVVTAAARDWGDPKSAETRALATNLSECMWPALHDLLAMDYPARGATTANANMAPTSTGGSGVGRAVIETSARSIALLLRAGVWGWGKAEAAIVAPHTPSTFWRGAGAPYRALALRLYARLLDATPVLYAGVGAPLLKLWMLATMDPSGGGAAARGLARARARLTRAAKRHSVLFAAFPTSEALRGCERSDATTTITVRAGWVREALRHAATTSAAPRARIAAIAASNAFWDALPSFEAEARGTSAEGPLAAASAMVLATCASHLAEALKTTPTMIPMVRKIVQLSASRGARNCETRASTLSHLFLAIATVFDARDSNMLAILVAALHEAVERPSDIGDVDVIWHALDKTDATHAALGISSEKVVVLKEYILSQCAKRSIERVRYSAASASAAQSAKGWCHALASLAKNCRDDIEWFIALTPAFLDAMQPPAVPVGKGAAPPPISIAQAATRAVMYAALATVVEHHPSLIQNVQGDVESTSVNAVSVFFVAATRAAMTEVAHALGGAEESKGYAPLSEADRNAAGRRLRAALGTDTSSPTPRALEEAYRGFTAPVETDKPNTATDANVSTPAIAALKFLAVFASATPAAAHLIKAHVLSPIKAAMKRKETHARRMLVAYVHDLWAAVGLIQHSSKENTAPTMMDSAPPTPAKPAIVLPRMPWPRDAAAPCAFSSIANVPKGTGVNVIGQLVRREPKRGVVAKANPKTGKSFDMAFFTLSDHAGDELRVQLIGKSAKACTAALDVDGMPSDVVLGFIGLAGQSAKGSMAMAWDPKSEAKFILNPEYQ